MIRSTLATLLVMPMAAGLCLPAAVRAQDASALSGHWSLNRELSQFPAEIGFTADWMSATPTGGDSSGDAGGQRSGGGGRTSFPVSRVSREDAMRSRALTDEVREPAAHLTIVETADTVTIASDGVSSRTFHFAGTEEVLPLGDGQVTVVARREAGALVITYKVGPAQELRYTYSRAASPPQLVVETQFLDHGRGDRVRRVYEPGTAAKAPAATTLSRTPGAESTAATAYNAAAGVPASGDRQAVQDFDQRPDAEFKGLTALGVVVEELGSQALACGLRRDVLETAVTKELTGAGLRVLSNSDEDTYVYVNVKTATMGNGMCVSRYDAYLYTHTTARLSYHDRPVLVEVSLLHKGGMAGGAAAAHAEAVLKGVQEYVGEFATRVRDANQ